MIMYAGHSCATPAGVTPHHQCAVLKTARTHIYNITNSQHTVLQNILFTGNVSEQDSFGHKLSETNRPSLPPGDQ